MSGQNKRAVYNHQVMLRQTLPSRDYILTGTFLLITLVGIGVRLYQLGDLPYGLYQDEAVNGLNALDVLNGNRPLYFPENNGREPLYIYVMAITVGLFGNTVLGVRAASALFGILTIPACYVMGRQLLGTHRSGLITMTLVSISLWHIHLSRVGFRAVLLILMSALLVATASYTLRTRSIVGAVGSGVLLGLAAYTYLPARLIPLIIVVFAAYLLLFQREFSTKRYLQLALCTLIAAIIIALPFVILLLTHPDVVLGRSGQVAIWNETVHQGQPVQTGVSSILAAFGMFNWRGDDIWRHNVPGRPVFDVLTGIVFLAGVWFAMRRFRSEPALAFSLIWVSVMLLPTILAEDAPHFLRAAGVLPVIFVFPAYAFDQLLARFQVWWATALVLVILLVGLGFTLRDYFGCCYQTDPVRGYFFQAEATQLADVLLEEENPVRLDARLWNTFPSLRFLLAKASDIELLFEDLPLQPARSSVTIVAWPFSDLTVVRAGLPEQATVEVINGPQTRGDLEPETYQLYVLYRATTTTGPNNTVAMFGSNILLKDIAVMPEGNGLSVRLSWAPEAPIDQPTQLFVQYVTSERQVLAQHDAPLGTQFYPALSWQMGHVIIQTADVLLDQPLPEGQLLIGLYHPESEERLTITGVGFPIENNALVIDP